MVEVRWRYHPHHLLQAILREVKKHADHYREVWSDEIWGPGEDPCVMDVESRMPNKAFDRLIEKYQLWVKDGRIYSKVLGWIGTLE